MARGRPSSLALRALDGGQYAVALTLMFVAIGIILPYVASFLLLGAGSLGGVSPLRTVRTVLFFAGFGAMALGALKLRPEPPYKENSRLSLSMANTAPGEEKGFADQVAALPPLGWYDPAEHERLSGGGRLLLASGVMLLTSFLVEVLFLRLGSPL